MKYIDAIKGSLIALVVFVIIAIYVQGFGSTPTVETILTVTIFLFAILAGFFISRLNLRYDRIRELVALEDAYFFSLYKSAVLYGKKFSSEISDKIDKYYIASFDSDITEYYKNTIESFNGIYETMYSCKDKRSESAYANMISMLATIEENRNKNSIVALERLSRSQWAVLVFLTAIILFCLYYLKTPEFYSQFLTVLLSTILILVLLTMRDLQNLRLGGGIMPVLESGEEVLESMGKLRYYNEMVIEEFDEKIPEYVKEYRLGVHIPGEKVKIKKIKR